MDCYVAETPEELEKFLEIALKKLRIELETNSKPKICAIMIHGAPGTGKSYTLDRPVKKVYGEDANIIRFYLAACEPSDVIGIPDIDREKRATFFNPPLKLPRTGKGAIVFEDFNLAPLSNQLAVDSLILDREAWDYRIPKTYAVILTCNKKEHRAGVHDIPTRIMNRCIHVELKEPDKERTEAQRKWLNSWVNWAIENGVDTRIITYLNWRPESLFTFEPRKTERAFATPRSWEFVNTLIKGEEDLEWIEKAVASAVGQKIALDFISFIKLSKEFDIKRLFEKPEELNTEELDAGRKYALVSALANYFINKYIEKPSKSLMDKFLTLIKKFDIEFQVLLFRLTKEVKQIADDYLKHLPTVQELARLYEFVRE